MENLKQCIECKIIKDRNEFFLRKKDKNWIQGACKQCSILINNTYKSKNSHKVKIVKKREYLKNKDRYVSNGLLLKYGITLGEYNTLLISQNNCCKICMIDQRSIKKRLCVDHCHKTGKIRGILCANCNSMLGMSGDDEDILRRGIEYLKNI